MNRITRDWLKSRVHTLNIMLERSPTIWNSGASAGEQNVGHLMLDKDSTGYRLVEIVSPTGGECSWTKRLTAKEMNAAIDNIIVGIGLCNTHISMRICKDVLEKSGQGFNFPMYSRGFIQASAECIKKD